MSASVWESWSSSSTTRTCALLMLDDVIEHSDQMVGCEWFLNRAVHGTRRRLRTRLVDQVRISATKDHRHRRAHLPDRQDGLRRTQVPQPQIEDRRDRAPLLQQRQPMVQALRLEDRKATRAQWIADRAQEREIVVDT